MKKDSTAKHTVSSELAKLELFYEHTDDKRVIMNKQSRPLKRPTRSTATRR